PVGHEGDAGGEIEEAALLDHLPVAGLGLGEVDQVERRPLVAARRGRGGDRCGFAVVRRAVVRHGAPLDSDRVQNRSPPAAGGAAGSLVAMSASLNWMAGWRAMGWPNASRCRA